MRKTKISRKALSKRETDARLAILSAAVGIPQAELKRRVIDGRKQAEQEAEAQRVKQREHSIRFNVEQIGECLSDIEDLTDALRHLPLERMTVEAVAHGAYAIAGRLAEFLQDLRWELGIDEAPDAE